MLLAGHRSGAPGRWVYRAYQWFWTAVDWLYPPVCGGCGARGRRWCAGCEGKVRRILPPVCAVCGEPQTSEGVCGRCREEPPPYRALRSWAVYGEGLRRAIHRLKYGGDLALGDTLSRPLMELLRLLNWQVDLVAPVPIGLARLTERGYNQAALLARPIAWGLGWAYCPGGLYRRRETRSQVGLSLAERRENVREAFGARPEQVRGRSVLVVDDVTTSGATLQACARALLEAGAAQVYGLTLARAVVGEDLPARPG